jgi:hypothetical protein
MTATQKGKKAKEAKEAKTVAEGKDFLQTAGSSKRREIKRHALPEKGSLKTKKEPKKTAAKKISKALTMKETAKEATDLLDKDPLGDTTKTNYKPFQGSYKD